LFSYLYGLVTFAIPLSLHQPNGAQDFFVIRAIKRAMTKSHAFLDTLSL